MAEAEANELKGIDRFYKHIDDLKKTKTQEDKEKLKEDAKKAMEKEYFIKGKLADPQEMPAKFVGKWTLIDKDHTIGFDDFLAKGGMPWVKRKLIKTFLGNSLCVEMTKIEGGMKMQAYKPKEQTQEIPWGTWIAFVTPTGILQMMRIYLVEEPENFEGDGYESGSLLVMEKFECNDEAKAHIRELVNVRYLNKDGHLVMKKLNLTVVNEDGSYPTMYRILRKMKTEK